MVTQREEVFSENVRLLSDEIHLLEILVVFSKNQKKKKIRERPKQSSPLMFQWKRLEDV
jgi:hypothetical protein